MIVQIHIINQGKHLKNQNLIKKKANKELNNKIIVVKMLKIELCNN